jgi:hypothetical protein
MMNSTASGTLVADIGNTGGAGTLIVFILIAASIVIFVALAGSLRRLRQNVSDGSFAAKAASEEKPADPPKPRT